MSIDASNPAGSITDAALKPTPEQYTASFLPDYANPIEFVQNDLFDDNESEVERLASTAGTQPMTFHYGSTYRFLIKDAKYPIQFASIRINFRLLQQVWATTMPTKSTAWVGNENIFLSLLKFVQILINKSPVLTFNSTSRCSLNALATIEEHVNIPTKGNCAAAHMASEGNTFGGCKDPVFDWQVLSSPINAEGTIAISVSFKIDLPLLNSHEHLMPGNTLEVVLTTVEASAPQPPSYWYFNPALSRTAVTNLIVKKSGVGAYPTVFYFDNYKMFMTYKLTPLKAAVYANLVKQTRLLANTVVINDYSLITLSPTWTQFVADPRWSEQPISFYITTASTEVMPLRVFFIPQFRVLYSNTEFCESTFAIPGAITIAYTNINGVRYNELPSMRIALENFGGQSTSTVLNNYMFYNNLRQANMYDTTNTSNDRLNIYKGLECNDYINIRSSLKHYYDSRCNHLAQVVSMCSAAPAMVNMSNIPNNIDGICSNRPGILEVVCYMAPIDRLSVDGFDETFAAVRSLQYYFSQIQIIVQHPSVVSYGIGLPTSISRISSVLPMVSL